MQPLAPGSAPPHHIPSSQAGRRQIVDCKVASRRAKGSGPPKNRNGTDVRARARFKLHFSSQRLALSLSRRKNATSRRAKQHGTLEKLVCAAECTSSSTSPFVSKRGTVFPSRSTLWERECLLRRRAVLQDEGLWECVGWGMDCLPAGDLFEKVSGLPHLAFNFHF